MTDEQTWAILTAPADLSDPDLARQLGLTYAAVHSRRWTLRNQGWTCRLRFAPCMYCGELITMPPTRSRTDRPFHPDCHNRYLRDKVMRRYHELSDEEKRAGSLASRLVTQTAQEASLQRAVNHGAPWTEAEDAYLEANLHRTPRELAAELNRSYYGVEARQQRMRRAARNK